MARRVVTLDIGSAAVRVVEVLGNRVVKWASRSLRHQGATPEGKDGASGWDALTAAVKQLDISAAAKGASVIANVSGLYSVSRVLAVPNPAGTPLTTETVLNAVRGTMTLSEDEQYLFWQSLDVFEGGEQVLVVGLPRDVIDSEVRALRAAGVKPHMLGLNAMALARAVGREDALILNIESSTFDTVVVVGGGIEVMRTSAWNPSNLTTEEQAEHLAVALELAAGFHNSRRPDLPLDPTTPLVITGQMSGEAEMIKDLRARVPYPLAALEPPLEYPADLPLSEYGVNIGLALKKAASKKPQPGSHSPPDVDLLPQVYRAWKPSTRQVWFFSAILVALLMWFPLSMVASSALKETSAMRKQYNDINTALQLRQVELKAREPLEKAIAEYGNIVRLDGSFTEDLRVVQDEARKLGIEVQSIDHAGTSITVVGRAGDYNAFRSYVAALEKSGRFDSVTPPPESYPFSDGGAIVIKPKTSK